LRSACASTSSTALTCRSRTARAIHAADRLTGSPIEPIVAPHPRLREYLSAVLLLLALVLFAVVTGLRFAAGSDVGEGITLLYTLPIGLLAVRYGPRGGLAGAALGMALFAVWAAADDVDVSPTGYLTRAVAFGLLGGLAGHLAHERSRLGSANTRWFDMSNDMLCEASFDGRFTRLNDRWERCLGWTREELMARPYGELVHPDDVASTAAATAALAERPSEVVDFENRYRTRDGSWRWLLWSASSDADRIYAIAKDITERKRLQEEREELLGRMEAMARTDPLTGLPNRRSWDEEVRLAMARAQRQDQPLALAMVDLDRFKAYNDAHGHPAGDALLAEAAASWRVAVRVTDFLARYGGEEFALLLPDCPPDEAAAVVDRLRAATPEDQTCSAGIACWDGSETPEELVARADAALYEAKSGGRDRIVTAA
jgi:diguanylate cyclase (GGDEF)-like protein/PAS domain S-box-containing protein